MTKVWEKAGHEITVLAGMVHYNTGKKSNRYIGKYTFEDQFSPKIKIWRSHVSEAYNINFIGRLWAYFSFVFSSIYTGLFKVKEKHDVILVTSPPLFVGISAFIISKFKRIPMIFEVRDLWPESAIGANLLKNRFLIKLAYWFEGFIYKKSKLINVLTPAFRKNLITEKAVSTDKIIFIPNAADFIISDKLFSKGFDIDAFKKAQSLEGKTIITYVGAHGVANHLIQVIDTAELIQEKLPTVLFLLIGDGMQKEMLINEVKSRSLNNVRFMDPVPKKEIFKYILASDFGASILKKAEVFKTIYSNKTFDYMSCKKPIFLLIDGVSRTLVEKAKCGIYVEPENSKEWSLKIELMLQKSQHDLSQMGESGYQFAKKHFDRNILAEQYIQQIEEKVLNV